MNEQEIIKYLKKNKEHCVIFMKMPKPVQDYFENTYKKIGYKMLILDGTWSCNQYVIPLRADGVYTLPDNYEAPKVEPEILELDVDPTDLHYAPAQCDERVILPRIRLDNTELTLIIKDTKYRFIGYKFDGVKVLHNYFLYFKYIDDKNLWAYQYNEKRKPVYASKVVYQKVG